MDRSQLHQKKPTAATTTTAPTAIGPDSTKQHPEHPRKTVVRKYCSPTVELIDAKP